MEHANSANVDEPQVVTREEFYFKAEIMAQLDDQTKRCIKNILRTAEIIIPNRESPEFKHLRKAVLDAVNELNREVQERLEKVI